MEDPENAILRSAGEQAFSNLSVTSSEKLYPTRKWLFRIRVPDLQSDEVVCVCGNVPELGSWFVDKSIPLDQEEDTEVWSKVINIPDKQEVQFRYCVCVIVENGLQVIVRSWETNLRPRKIGCDDKTSSYKEEPHSYGDYDNNVAVDRGWLTKETTIQLKLACNNALTIWRPKFNNRSIYIKLTPVNLLRHNTNIPKTMSEALEESLSTDTQDMIESPQHAYTEVIIYFHNVSNIPIVINWKHINMSK